MKMILARTLMVTLLATSISAFAKTESAKSEDATTPTNVSQQVDCNRKANVTATKDDQQSTEERKVQQQDQDWQHDLQGTYGG